MTNENVTLPIAASDLRGRAPGHGVHHGAGDRRGQDRRGGGRVGGWRACARAPHRRPLRLGGRDREDPRGRASCPAARRPSSSAACSAPPSAPPCPAPARPCGSRPSPSTRPETTAGPRAGPRVPGRAREHPPHPRRAAAWRRSLRDITEPGRSPTWRGTRPTCAGPEGRGARDRRPRGAPAPRPGLGPRHAGRPDAARADQDQRRRGHGEDPARVPACAASSRPSARSSDSSRAHEPTKSPDDYRAKLETRDLPEHVRTAVVREVDKLERTSEQSPEHGWIRTWLDTVFEVPWGVESDDRLDVDRGRRDPRRGPRRPEGRQGADPRAPGGAQAAGRPRPRARRRPRLGCHPGPGRSSGRGQDVAG